MIKGRIQSVMAAVLAVITLSALVGLDVLRNQGDVMAVPGEQQQVEIETPPERLPPPASPELLDLFAATGLEDTGGLPQARPELGLFWDPEFGELPYAPDQIPAEFTDQFHDPGEVPTDEVEGLGDDAGKLLAMPVNGRPTSPYGMRFHPILRVRKLHTGADWAAPCGTPIGAAEAGRVTRAGWANGYGIHVRIDHGMIAGMRVVTTYSHLSSLGVRVGQEVERGQGIGRVGTTGYSTGCHLHFEVIANGKFTNPIPWLNTDPADVDVAAMLEGGADRDDADAGEDSDGEATEEATEEPSEDPSAEPSEIPSEQPSEEPSEQPSEEPSEGPSGEPSEEPSGEPSEEPGGEPSEEPSGTPSPGPGGSPSPSPSPGESGSPEPTPSGSPGASPEPTEPGAPSAEPSPSPSITASTEPEASATVTASRSAIPTSVPTSTAPAAEPSGEAGPEPEAVPGS